MVTGVSMRTRYRVQMQTCTNLWLRMMTQSRFIGAVRGTHSQLWGTITPVSSPYAARKYDRRFGTPAIV